MFHTPVTINYNLIIHKQIIKRMNRKHGILLHCVWNMPINFYKHGNLGAPEEGIESTLSGIQLVTQSNYLSHEVCYQTGYLTPWVRLGLDTQLSDTCWTTAVAGRIYPLYMEGNSMERDTLCVVLDSICSS